MRTVNPVHYFTGCLVCCLIAVSPVSTLGRNTTNPYQPYTTDPHTVALYHLDEQSGEIAADASGNALDAAVIGGQWTTEGTFDGAIHLDGGAYLSLPESTLLTASDSTMEAWVYRESSAVSAVIDAAGTDIPTPTGRILRLDELGFVWATVVQAHVGWDFAISTTAVPLNEWTHVAALFSQSEQYLAVAVNGIVEATTSYWPVEGAPTATVGRALATDDYYLVGKVDEVRISSVVRDFEPVAVERSTWSTVRVLWR